MHKGFIPLPDGIKLRCLSLINLGRMMNLFNIEIFERVANVHCRLLTDQLLMHHIQDLMLLSSIIMDSGEINEYLYEDINELNQILDIFVNVAACPIRSCGLWL
jgi:hypothetical protein